MIRSTTLRRKPLSARIHPAKAAAFIEDLESRVLLSVSHAVATHDFVISRSAHSNVSRALLNAPNGLTPAIIRQAYGINQVSINGVVGDGSGQTIAIVDAYNDPTIAADLHTFDTLYGLPDTTLTRINQSGGTTLPGNDPSGRGNSWAVETSLDVEWAHAVAPDATILLVLASSDSDANLMAAVNTARNHAGVSVVSMSWGGDESSTDPTQNSSFTTPSGHIGVTFVAASGDSGAYGSNGTTKIPGYPAASPNVLAVGGTTLDVDSSGDYLSESGWGSGTSSAINGGSGGGISRYESQPAYQHSVVTQSSTFRALPDVSFDADPASGVAVIDSWDFGNSTPVAVGGTSLAAPMWAGVIALADQARVLGGLGTLDGATQTLPKIYALPSSDFHDITTGNNGYAAGPGFDLVTGRGTPIVNKLVVDLASGTTPPPAPKTPGIGTFAVSPGSVVSGSAITLTASNVTETGGTVTSVNFYRESNGQAGLQTGSDVLVGAGIKNGTTWTLSTSAAGLGGGSYTYYAVASDTNGVTSAVAQVALTVVTPTISSFSVSPSTVNPGANVTLSANASETGGTVASVTFYRESNGSAGQQSTDTVVGTGVRNGITWTLAISTTGMTAGNYTYYAVATDAVGLTTTSSATLTIAAPASSNDNFASGTILSGTAITVTGTNVGATKQPGEPAIAGNAGGHSVWYTWTATSSGIVMVDTSGSNFDTLLGVYTGNAANALTLVTSNDDDPTVFTTTSRLAFSAVAGTTYHIVVDGYNGAMGNIALHLNQTVAPANDDFANATVLTGSTATWTGTNVGATKQAGEPYVAGNGSGGSVWLVWTAPSSGTFTLSTAGSNFDTMLAVYTGNAVNALTPIAYDDDVSRSNTTSAVTFNATAGTTYRIQIDGYDGAEGNIQFALS